MDKSALIVEDDPDIALLVQVNLRQMECRADIAPDGLVGLRLATERAYDIILLDITLPGLNGIEVCRRLREQGVRTPVIMLTSRDDELDKVLAISLGADDYLTKPFSIRELLARVKARLRRFVPEKEPGFPPELTPPTRLAHGPLVLDTELHRVTLAGAVVPLTAKEFELLTLFMRHPGRAYTRPQLLEQVWGTSYAGYEHTVNSHINRLRLKIEQDPARPTHILTVWGVGYQFTDEPGR